ncbi:MAG: rRNA maturation RNase YbeY [Aquificaceae bacterium]
MKSLKRQSRVEVKSEAGFINLYWVKAIAQTLVEAFEIDRIVSIYITDDLRIKDLNKKFRNINSPTDVLSFELSEFYLGEIVISWQSAKKNALESSHSLREEIKLLLAHGFTHLLGLDHEIPAQKELFFSTERKAIEIISRKLTTYSLCNLSRNGVHSPYVS